MKTLVAFYDLAVGPTSYDFVVFAIQAEMARVRGHFERLHFVFVPDPVHYTRPKPAIYSSAEARWRLHQICLPACALIGASYTLAPDWEQVSETFGGEGMNYPEYWPEDWYYQTLKIRRHLVGDVIARSRAGEAVPKLSASGYALDVVRKLYRAKGGKPVVTMTMRRTYLKDRNSNPDSWREAARYIESKGFAVELIADTSEALESGRGFANLNLDLRMACYQEAALNLQANNGAASLCWFSDRPYRMFGCGDEHWDGLFVKQGLPLGESWPWARPDQKLCYGRETAETIIAEFEAWRSSGVR